ncbi:MAG: pentapeptide repeat-containing protein [Iphinoe sp. HA4291-MV1]|jgi:uncharacterized protein YjbI with pentapeptide repeats|nr:pentapeptide repeat-containing protein [Iphinoe sp. HA4291-MV1]
MPQDFSGQNLRGRSFKGQNLEGANFSRANIQGADFSNANLRGANFSHVKAGLQRRWAISLLMFSLLLSVLSGLVSVNAGGVTALLRSLLIDKTNFFIFLIPLVLIATFVIVTIRWGLESALRFWVVSFTVCFAGIIIWGLSIVVTGIAGMSFLTTTWVGFISGMLCIFFAVTLALVGALILAFAVVVAEVIAGALAGTIALIITGAMVATLTLIATFVIALIENGTINKNQAIAAILVTLGMGPWDGAVIGIVALAMTFLGGYIGWRAKACDEKYTLVRKVAVAFAARGTSFRDANLMDADFIGATLKNTDFREAILTRTCFHKTKKLDSVRPGKTYLQNVQVRQLVITGKGENKNFDRLDLRGLNLREANLENASFIDADFYQANLSNANLSRTILVRTNLERANLRGACLTGSCIQDWTISKGTKLDRIICDYVYLKWLDGDKRDQMPPRGKFKEDGFVLFAKYILDTIDIYHSKDINPRLALTVLKKISRDYDEPLDIVAIGKRGDRVFIKVKLSENVEPDRFKEDYYSRYDENLKIISSSPKPLPSVDELVENRLAEIASNKTDETSSVNVTYIEYINTHKDLIIKGESIVETIKTGGDTINQSGGTFGIGVNKGEVHAEKIAGTINEAQQQNLVEAAAEIQQLLKQLKETNPTETETVIVAKAADEIRNNPTLKARVISALKSGGKEAFKEAVDNPLVNVLIAIIEGWQEAE